MTRKNLLNLTDAIARELWSKLKSTGCRIVFAESCTAGLASAIMGQFPGVSKYLCGSSVVYQAATKTSWLRIEPELIQKYSAESSQVTCQMAISVLKKTPSADFSVAVTGHLENMAADGSPFVWVAIGYRRDNQILNTESQFFSLTESTRIDRQWQAAQMAMVAAIEFMHTLPAQQRPILIEQVDETYFTEKTP